GPELVMEMEERRFDSNEENANEVRDQLVRTSAGFALGIRECPEANPRGVRPVEGACQLQGRVLRGARRRVGWPHAGRLRRSARNPQILFDAPGLRLRGATRHCGRGCGPQRARGDCLARWTERQEAAGT